MALVTLANGQKRDVTAANYKAVALEALAAERARGRDVDEAATYRAFRQLGGEQVEFYTYNPSTNAAAVVPPPAATAVLDNPFVKAADAVTGSLSPGANATLTQFSATVREWVSDAGRGLSTAAAAAKSYATETQRTVAILYVVGAVAVVSVAAAVIVVKVKR
jgi:hypothetical protein